LRCPFNEAKYKALLEGLEVSEVMLSELERTKRIDSEFYKKENLQIVSFIKEKGCNNLVDLVSISDGNHMSISDKFSEAGIPYYRGQDIHSFFIENAHPIYIDEKTFDQPVLKRSHLQKDDLLLSIVGTIGKVSLVYSRNKSTCSCKLAILRSKGVLSSELLAVFLSSKYGQNQIQKFVRGAVQMGLILEDMNQLFVPIFSNGFDEKIKDKITLAYNKNEQSQTLYRQAEDLLLETIGLKGFEPSRENKSVKSFKESFLATGRLDAEYYQPKYEEIESYIRQYKCGFSFVKDQFKQNKATINYLAKEYNYIEISDINVSNGAYNYNKIETHDLPANAKIKSGKNDLLISKVRPNRGAISIIDNDIDFIVSGAFTVLKEKTGYKKEVLFVYLRLKQIREWLLKYNVGTSYPVIKDEDILNLPIPMVDDKTQRRIASLIKKSFTLRAESERLLDEAKEAVEWKIEK
jgi:hypothetical protein